MQAKDVMTTPVVTVGPDTPVADIARRLIERRISAVPVVDADGRPIGIVSEGDLIRRPETGGERRPSWWLMVFAEPQDEARAYVKAHGGRARDVMTRDLVTVEEDTPLEDIATLLERHRIKRVPVLRQDKLVGIVSRANLLHGLVTGPRASKCSIDDRALRKRVMRAISASGARSEFINAVVAEGIVHLWGTAYSDVEREAIELAASSAAGAATVKSQVGVFPPRARKLFWAE